MDRRERVNEAYKNLYWTRIIDTSSSNLQEFERFAMAADIICAWDEIDELSAMISLGHRVHFDPRQFSAEHPAPTIDEFMLDSDDL